MLFETLLHHCSDVFSTASSLACQVGLLNLECAATHRVGFCSPCFSHVHQSACTIYQVPAYKTRLAEVHGLVAALIGFAGRGAAGARVGVADRGPVRHTAWRLKWDKATRYSKESTLLSRPPRFGRRMETNVARKSYSPAVGFRALS